MITDAPNVRWGTDATMAWTKNDGWVWVFALLDHHTDEAWAHVAKVGNRFAALQPLYDAVIDRFGGLGPDIARGIKLRHDWGSQYRAHHFQGSLSWLGIEDDAAFVGEPQGNGVAERFMRDPQRAVPVVEALRGRRRPAPRGGRLHRALQRAVAHRTPGSSHPTRGVQGCNRGNGRVIVMEPVQSTGASTACYPVWAPTTSSSASFSSTDLAV